MAGDRDTNAPGQLRGEAEIEPEDAGEGGVHAIPVERSEEERGERDRERGAEARLEAALHEAAAEQLLGDPRCEADPHKREQERATPYAGERPVELRKHAVLAQPGNLEHAVEPVARRDGAEYQERLPSPAEGARREPQPHAERRRPEGRTSDRNGEQEDLDPEALERQRLGGRRAAGQRQVARREARDRAEREQGQGLGNASAFHRPEATRPAADAWYTTVVADSLAPAFLVAMPQLLDPNFRRSVVLLIHHDAEGTFGVVLNRPTELTATDLCTTLELEWCGDPDKEVGWGGPVQPQTGWMLFDAQATLGSGDVKDVAEGIGFAGSLDVLRALAQDPPEDLQLLLGYAGWGPGQLENELAEGAWLLVPVSRDAIFEVEPGSMWEHVVRSLGIEPSTLVATRGIH